MRLLNVLQVHGLRNGDGKLSAGDIVCQLLKASGIGLRHECLYPNVEFLSAFRSAKHGSQHSTFAQSRKKLLNDLTPNRISNCVEILESADFLLAIDSDNLVGA